MMVPAAERSSIAAATVCSGVPAGEGRLAPRPMAARWFTGSHYLNFGGDGATRYAQKA